MNTKRRLLKADLHTHTYFSGPAHHLEFMRCHDSYSQPIDVYRTAKARGMDLVTITDHDSIDGCLQLLDKYPDLDDFFISEEVTCHIPDMPSNYVHVNVFNINERIHAEIHRLRNNLYELAAYLKKEQVIYSLNHMFHGYRNSTPPQVYVEKMLELFDVFEGKNGSMTELHNTLIKKIVKRSMRKGKPKSLVAGSDSHTLRRIATFYTATYAADKEEFFENIRKGRTLMVGGKGGNALTIAGDIYGVILRYYPNIVRFWSGEFSLPTRIRNIGLSLLCIPFLPTPLVVSLKHTTSERSKLVEIWKALESSQSNVELRMSNYE
jgi:predicted metal-dependent phosphoesterase TrpH